MRSLPFGGVPSAPGVAPVWAPKVGPVPRRYCWTPTNDPAPVKRAAVAPALVRRIEAFGVAALGKARREEPISWTVACWAAGWLMPRIRVCSRSRSAGPAAVAGSVTVVDGRMATVEPDELSL